MTRQVRWGDLLTLLVLTFSGCVAIIAFGYNRSWNMIAFTTSHGIFIGWMVLRSRDSV